MSALPVAMHRLACHAESDRGAVRAVEASVRRDRDGAVVLCFVLTGDLAHIAIPVPREPRRVDGLWRHTCFECFIRTDGGGYLEFNFSPSREWAAYVFRGYRDPDTQPHACDVQIAVSRDMNAIRLDATIPGSALDRVCQPCSVGLSAVVEETSGAISYWALRHAPGKPDFHHDEAFALEV